MFVVMCCTLVLLTNEIAHAQQTPIASAQDTGLYIVGYIRDEVTKKPVRARFEYELQPSSIRVATDSSEASGRFFTQLPYLARYEVHITADDYFPITEKLGVSRVDQKRVIEREYYMKPLKSGTVVELEGVNFETGSATLTESSHTALNAVKRLLEERPTMRVEIAGHTDNVGDAEANRLLSLERAKAVVSYLIDNGIAAERLIAKGYGESRPITTNSTEAGKEANRRVEFFVID